MNTPASSRTYYLAHREEILAKNKQLYWADPEKFRAKNLEKVKCYQKTEKGRNSVLLRRYGITATQYDEAWIEQLGQCAICHGTESLCVDHCHATQKVRGLLCIACNRAIGSFKDSPIILKSAASYLEDAAKFRGR